MSLRDIITEITATWADAKTEPFAAHPTATLVRNTFAQYIRNHINTSYPSYTVKASAGAGNWAEVAWLSILNPQITDSTQSGIYPVYLFSADGSGVYLSLGFGTTDLKEKYGSQEAVEKARELREVIRNSNPDLGSWDSNINLHSNTPLGQSYEWASAGAKYYESGNIPDESVLIRDLEELLKIYSQLDIPNSDIVNPNQNTSLSLTKPFLLLAGISGTGKTRFIREQAKESGAINETYCLTPVRPDWHEPSDLLGYISRLNGGSKYVTTEVLGFIIKAWASLVDSQVSITEEHLDGFGQKFVVKGTSEILSDISPYWLCLDEMNLAPVEQYFSDYLSVLETREWKWIGDEFTYSCDSLMKASTVNALLKENGHDENAVRNSLDISDSKFDELWELTKLYGISIPFNLIVAGTVNMDETTHGFSRKVIDRALSFDFGEFFPNEISEFFNQTITPKTLRFPSASQATQDMFANVQADPTATKTKLFYESVNEVLKETPFELAYRAFNELCLSVCAFSPTTDEELQAVFDDFLMCKVLPRIEGDEDKLVGSSTVEGDNLLAQLITILKTELENIWDADRVDLMREKIDSDEPVTTKCRSHKKLRRMEKLLENGFTSFWP